VIDNKHLFIVFEGIDACGKSTQADLLKDYFLAQGDRAVLSPEPSSGIIGNLVRAALQKRIFFTSDRDRFDEQMAYLFAADRYDHLYNDIDGVFKLIKDGIHVIATRYYFSSLAYNSHTEAQANLVKRLNAGFPDPDLLIYIDIPVRVSCDRLQKKGSQEIYETEEKLKRVRDNYENIFSNYLSPILRINGTEDRDLVHRQIIDYISKL
jgi:dTMP kinase